MEECRSAEDLTVVPSSFGQCTSACIRNPNCTGFLFSPQLWIGKYSDEVDFRQGQRCDLRISQRPLPVRGSETQSTSAFFVFRRAGCDTFSCPSWGRPLPAPKLLPDAGAVTEAQCCTCSAPGAVQDRKENCDPCLSAHAEQKSGSAQSNGLIEQRSLLKPQYPKPWESCNK